MADAEPSTVTYEQLAELEYEFDDLDAEICSFFIVCPNGRATINDRVQCASSTL